MEDLSPTPLCLSVHLCDSASSSFWFFSTLLGDVARDGHGGRREEQKRSRRIRKARQPHLQHRHRRRLLGGGRPAARLYRRSESAQSLCGRSVPKYTDERADYGEHGTSAEGHAGSGVHPAGERRAVMLVEKQSGNDRKQHRRNEISWQPLRADQLLHHGSARWSRGASGGKQKPGHENDRAHPAHTEHDVDEPQSQNKRKVVHGNPRAVGSQRERARETLVVLPVLRQPSVSCPDRPRNLAYQSGNERDPGTSNDSRKLVSRWSRSYCR